MKHGLRADARPGIATHSSKVHSAAIVPDAALVEHKIAAADAEAASTDADASGSRAALMCGCGTCMKAARSLAERTAADNADAPGIITTDTVPDDISTTATVTVDGEHVVSTLDQIGDQDFYKIELEAGEYYQIGVFAKVAGPSLTPLADAYVELYDEAGNALSNADGGKPGDDLGLDALLSFQATYTGVYYINARAFDDDGSNGTTGDHIGDYEVFADKITVDPYAYKPYYGLDSPLHSIDWGTQMDGSSRNPDGDQGPRDNGEDFTGVGWNPYGIEGKNVLTFYFAKLGEVYVGDDPTEPGLTADMVQARNISAWEQAAYKSAFDRYAEVADLVYIETQHRQEADFKILTYAGTPGIYSPSVLGRASAPDTEGEGQMEFNAADERYTKAGLTQGGFFYQTLLHEFGHAHGLAHPHDNGGYSSVMRGGGGGTGGIGGGTGDFGLSQQIFTIMSYNSGWYLSPYGQASDMANYGWVGGLSALDIAVIQDKYGVNEDFASGNNVYNLRDINKKGTFYECIWDAGGKDVIRYGGANDAMIDLRDATLQYEAGGGGWVSYVDGIFGGFTIANAAVIENARGGSGNDTLIGNEVANMLSGGDGHDILNGGVGRDLLKGGLGNDRFVFDLLNEQTTTIADLSRKERIDLSGIDADTGADGDQAFHLVASFSGDAGEAVLRFNANKDKTYLQLDVDGDGVADMTIAMTGDHDNHDRFIL